MNKLLFITGLSGILFIANTVFAEDINTVDVITPAEAMKINQIQYNYNQHNNVLEMRITEYTNKIELIKNDINKSDAQKSLLISAYERNIETLKLQQKQLEKEANNSYKALLGEEKYNIFKNQQNAEQSVTQDIIQE